MGLRFYPADSGELLGDFKEEFTSIESTRKLRGAMADLILAPSSLKDLK